MDCEKVVVWMFHPEMVRVGELSRYKVVLVAVLQAETYLRAPVVLQKTPVALCAFERDPEPKAVIFRCRAVHHQASGVMKTPAVERFQLLRQPAARLPLVPRTHPAQLEKCLSAPVRVEREAGE
jgi:hypothetical protein